MQVTSQEEEQPKRKLLYLKLSYPYIYIEVTRRTRLDMRPLSPASFYGIPSSGFGLKLMFT